MQTLNRIPRLLITALLITGILIFVGCSKEEPSVYEETQKTTLPEVVKEPVQVDVAKEMVINGDFEKGIEGWTLASGWVRTDKDGNKYLANGSNWQAYQILNLTPNATYTFKASTRKDIGDHVARFKLIFFDKNAQRLGYYNIFYKHLGTDWETIPTQTIKVPANTAETILYVLANGEKDTHAFDNISLVKKYDGTVDVVGKEITRTFNVVKELVINGSFTDDSGWSGLEDKVKTASDGNKYLANDYNWDVAQSVSVVPHKKHKFTVRTRKGTAEGASRFVIKFLDAEGKTLEPICDFTYQHQGTDWETVPTKTIYPPTGAGKARVYLLTDNTSEGTHHFDDISLTCKD